MEKHVGRLTKVLIKALKGKTWDGKEGLLGTLTSLCTHFPKHYEVCSEERKAVLDVMIKECGRKKLLYKRHALTGLARITRVFGDATRDEIYERVRQTLMTLVEQQVDDLSEDGDEEEGSREGQGKAAFLLAQSAALECLGASWSPSAGDGSQVINTLCGCLGVRGGGAWNVQIKAGEVMIEMMTRWVQSGTGGCEPEEALCIVKALRDGMKDSRVSMLDWSKSGGRRNT